MNFSTPELSSEHSTTPSLLYRSFSIPKKNEIDVVGLAVGVFFCVMGVTLVIYCITKASGCYNSRGKPRTEIKITYFDDEALTGASLPIQVEEETHLEDTDKPALDTLKLPCDHSNCLPLLSYTDSSGKAGNDCYIIHGKPFESDAIQGLKKMGIL